MSKIVKTVTLALFGYAAYKVGRITEKVMSDEGMQEAIKEGKEAIKAAKEAKRTGQTLRLEMNKEHLTTFLEPTVADEPETEESEDQPED